MKSAIVKKISQQLNNEIDSEPKALYLLAEIRKYIDRYKEGTKDNYPNLYFFCNWALHIKMDRTPAIKLLKRFEEVIDEINTKNLEDISNLFISKEINFYMFIDLKKELRIFFKLNNFPNKLVADHKNWNRFRYLLLRILMDCPLVNEKGKIVEFSFLEGRNKQICFRLDIKNNGICIINLKDETGKIMQELGYKD